MLFSDFMSMTFSVNIFAVLCIFVSMYLFVYLYKHICVCHLMMRSTSGTLYESIMLTNYVLCIMYVCMYMCIG
jgi:hypothetical protein